MAEQKQATEIIESVTKLVDAVKPEAVTTPIEPEPNYMLITIIGALITVFAYPLFLWIKKAFFSKGDKT